MDEKHRKFLREFLPPRHRLRVRGFHADHHIPQEAWMQLPACTLNLRKGEHVSRPVPTQVSPVEFLYLPVPREDNRNLSLLEAQSLEHERGYPFQTVPIHPSPTLTVDNLDSNSPSFAFRFLRPFHDPGPSGHMRR